MNKFLYSLLVLLMPVLGFAQETMQDPLAEKRTVPAFHGIEAATGIHVYLTQGNTDEVAVSALTVEYRDKIVTKVENGILKIYYDNKLGAISRKKEGKNLKAWVSCRMPDKLVVNTGAQVDFVSRLKGTGLVMQVNTGAMVKGEVDIESLQVKVNTGSQVLLTGKAGKLDVNGDTGSKFKGEDLVAEECHIEVSTGASITVNAGKELEVKANTGGTVRYKGAAALKEIKTNTGGSVSRI